MKDIELYCCYSLNLRNYLYDNGLRYKIAALNPNSKNLFWVYIKDEKLDYLLTKWSENRHTVSIPKLINYLETFGGERANKARKLVKELIEDNGKKDDKNNPSDANSEQ